MRFRRPNLSALALLCLSAGLTQAAETVVLQLRNGDRLTGTILAEQTNQITFQTSWRNVVVIPLAEVKAREAARPGQPAPAPPAETAPPQGPITGAPGTVPVVPVLPTAPGGLLVEPPLRSWSGEAQVGTDLRVSQRSRQLVSGRLKLGYTHERLHNDLDYTFCYGRSEGVLSDNRMVGSLKTAYDMTPRLFVFNLGGAGYDEIRAINLRYEVGPGLGYHLLQLPNLQVNVELGGNYQTQYLADQSTAESFYLRAAESLTWQFHARLSLDEKVEFFPNVERPNAYRFRAESNLNYALLSHLALVLTVLDEYDTETSAGVGQNDLQIRSSLSVKF